MDETAARMLTPEELARLFYKYPLNGFPILDDNYNFSGILQKRYIVNSMAEFKATRADVRRIIEKHVYYPSEGEIVRMIFGDRKIQEFPVLHRHGILLGVWELSAFFRIFDKIQFAGLLDFRKIFDVLPVPVLVVDDKEKLMSYNPAMEQETGLARDGNDGIGRRLAKVFEGIGWSLETERDSGGVIRTGSGCRNFAKNVVTLENGRSLTLYTVFAQAVTDAAPVVVTGRARPVTSTNAETPAESLPDAVERLERRMIGDALAGCEGNISQTAALLNVPRQTLQYKLGKYGLVQA